MIWGSFAYEESCQAPVPLSIFWSNSKFDENSKRSSFEYTRPITTIFCTRHDSDNVVTCAKYRCDRPRIFYTRVFWIFIKFRIRSKYVDGRLVSRHGIDLDCMIHFVGWWWRSTYLGWGLLNQFSQPLFLSIIEIPVIYDVHISQVLRQHSCGDAWWMKCDSKEWL